MIYVAEAGSGVPALMLHGIGGSADSFAPQIGPVAETHRVLAWDAPGYGRSPEIGVKCYSEAAADLLKERDAVPVHVVGVSWGTAIATRLAVHRPELVHSLVLAGPTRGSGTSPEKSAAMRERAADLVRMGPEAFARARTPRLLSPGAPQGLVDRVAETMARTLRPDGYARAAEWMATADHTGILGAITAPVHLVVGEHDAVTGVAEAEAMAEAIPGAHLTVLPGAGHLCNQERPDEFNRLLTEWLWATS